MKMTRRLLSVLLTLGLLFSLFAGLSVTAFAEDGDVTLSFAGADAEVITGSEGDAVTLPSAEVSQDGYSFLGWTDVSVAQTMAEPVYYAAGSSYMLPSADKTLYALYSYIDHRGTPSIDRYEKIASMDELKDGSYLIGVELEGNQLLAFDGSSANPNSSGNYQLLDMTAADVVACSAAADACAVRVYQLPDCDAYGIKMGNGSGKYIGSTGSTGMASRGTEPYPLTVEFDDGILIYVSTAEKNLYLSYYQTSSTQKFGFYNNTSSCLVDLYRKIDGIDGTLYYTGTVTDCDHAGTEGVLTEATCTEDGFTTYLCQICGYKWVVDGDDAIGHDYTATVTEPTASTQGYTTYVCNNCGDTYIDNYVDPFGIEYDVEYMVLGDSWRTETVNSYQGTALPRPDVVPDGYEFAGWAKAEYPDETTAAAVLTGTYNPDNDVTLYAVYKRSEFAAGSGDYKKLTSMPSGGLNGQFLVVYEGGGIAFNSAFATSASNLNKAGNYLSVTISNSTIAATPELDAASVEIAPVGTTGNYYMKVNCGLCIGSTGSSTANGLNGDKNKVYQNTITISGGIATIANAAATNTNGASGTTYNFAYNSSTVNRFCFCKPTTSTVCKVCLYQKQEGTTTYYYTTAPSTAGCEHEDYTEIETAPSCTEAGYTTFTCTNCGYKWTEAGEASLGHSYDNGVVTAPTPTAVGYTTYTCTVCGDTYQDDLVGFEFEITYNVLGTDREPVIVNNKDGADFPTDVPEVSGYKFAGWAEEEISEEINDAAVLAGHYIPTEDATYYAVYTRKEANTGDGNYYKVTGLPLVENGNYLIVDETQRIAFKAAEEDNEDYDLTKANNYISVSISGNMIEESFEADFASVVINPVEGTQTYSMTGSETGNYIGTTGSSTGIMENTKNPYPVTITFDAYGNAVICNVNGSTIYQLGYNTQSTSNKFGFFSPTSKTADDVALYCKDGSGFTTYYTTQPVINCAHDDVTEVEEVAATCTSVGYTAGMFCNDCQTYISGHEVIEKTAHTPQELPAVPATCTETGLTAGSICSVCDEILVAQEILPLAAHQYEMDESSDPTCAQDGYITWICAACDDTYEEIIPATGAHTYNATGVCTECGDKLISIESAVLRLDEDIDVIYIVKVPEGATAKMTFVMNGVATEVEDDGTHTFAFEGVNPQCMGDNIEANLTVTAGGATYTASKAKYSVREYCVNQLAKTTDNDLRTLLSDVLAYGAAAQIYMSYKTDALVSAGDDIVNPTCSTYTDLEGLAASFDGKSAEYIFWTGASLNLTNNVSMSFRFYAESTDDLTVTVSVNGRTEEFTEFASVGEKLYEITFCGIKANEFADAVTASFSTGGNTVSYSVNTYVCAKQNDSDANLAALVKALYNYGAAAATFAK